MSLMIMARTGRPGLELVQVDEGVVPIRIDAVEFSSVEEDVVVVLAALAEVSLEIGLDTCIVLSNSLQDMHVLCILSLFCMIMRRTTTMALICTRSAMTLRAVTICGRSSIRIGMFFVGTGLPMVSLY